MVVPTAAAETCHGIACASCDVEEPETLDVLRGAWSCCSCVQPISRQRTVFVACGTCQHEDRGARWDPICCLMYDCQLGLQSKGDRAGVGKWW